MTASRQVDRRVLLQAGASGFLGLGLSAAGRAAASGKARSVIVVNQTGAPSHIDTLDPKPDAPAEIRGAFGTTRTPIPGVLFGEHLPLLAARADRLAVVRSFSHKDNNHTAATHHLITGALQPGVRFDKPLSRDDWPCYGAGASYFGLGREGVPAAVTLPTFLGEGPLVWPGQHAGFLGPRHDPWQVSADPNRGDFKVDNLRLPDGVTVDTLASRFSLLQTVEASQRVLERLPETARLNDQQKKAASVLASGGVARAFEIDREPERVRDAYGRHMFGQSLLLARRLVESGVRVVQANMGRVQNWDSHSNNFNRLSKDLLPPLDRAVSALLDDLTSSGLIQDVLVVVMGEFGRTPKVDAANAGRDHWAACFSGLFFGAGVRGGNVIGRSDKVGAYPLTTPHSLDDLGATVYSVLGIDPESEMRDRQNRPAQLNRGNSIQSLWSG